MELFAEQHRAARSAARPLAARMRPRHLEEFAGQASFLAADAPFRKLLEADRLSSVIFFGPPGCGKTTLANLVARHTAAHFATLHAAEATVSDVREVLAAADARLTGGQRTVLFLDEIHRFNRAQQDVLLRDVENGIVILVGATTENPFATVNTPLLSRSQILEFQPLAPETLVELLRQAVTDPDRGLGLSISQFPAATLDAIANHAEGDARRAYNLLEAAATVYAETPEITPEQIDQVAQRRLLRHDTTGDQHYDVVSAYIKSIRGSDPDATLYWLARLLAGGEDPRFIARRLCIAASEDIGMADSHALVVASSAAQVVQFVGLPEAEYALAHATTYLACASKSIAVTQALAAAKAEVREQPAQPVPNHLRYSRGPGSRQLGRGVGYRYPPIADDEARDQAYLLKPRTYYNPTERGDEARVRAWLQARRAASQARAEKGAP